ncbi:SGNH/GDSL hydrolase family protein [Spirosoma soli]|uniref:SGNH/GDSL hydrolase family protein n=1 Tax=Spirosoma soli TaxID=1770529 RepID=A0ABW5M818_9BACT
MNVLVIGDEHTCRCGLPAGQLSYIGHFIRQISRTERSVSVEAYAHLTLPTVSAVLKRLPLNRYDLIILQLDYTSVQTASSAGKQTLRYGGVLMLPHLYQPLRPKNQNASERKTRLATLREAIRKFGVVSLIRPRRIATAIDALLEQLRPYRHNVMLLTPFPHREPVENWLRKRSRDLLMHKADNQLISVFDVNSVVASREEYFLTNSDEHLNAVSHELIGRALFDFYQSAPTIVTIQTIRRE